MYGLVFFRRAHLSLFSSPLCQTMKEMGNVKSNAIYNPDEVRNPPPTNMIEQERDSDLEKYIRGKVTLRPPLRFWRFDGVPLGKYEFKKFFDKRGVVAAKLGPSRSKDSFVRGSSPQPSLGTSTVSSSPPPR